MKKITKLIIPIMFLGFILPLFSVHAAGTAIMRLTSAKTDYYVGDNIYIQIQVEPKGETLNTVRAIMDFTGNSVLQISDFTLGTAFPYASPGRELNNTTQHVNVGGFILVDSVTQNSLFGTLIFKANQVGTSTINFAAGSHLISPDQEEMINLAGCQGITINVIGAPPPLPPENHAPVFQLVSDKQIMLGDSVDFHVSATDPERNQVTLVWDIPEGSIFNNVISASTASGDFSWTPTANGVYTLTFTATENAPVNPTAIMRVIISVGVPPPQQNHPPIFVPIAEKSINAGETMIFNVTATDPDNNNVNISMEPLETANISPITTGVTSTSKFNWTPENFGIYYAVFKATDDNVNPAISILTVRITVFGGKCPPCSGGGGGGTCPICQCQQQEFSKPVAKSVATISSPTHPHQDLWYANNNPKFIWETNDQPIGYTFNLDQNPLADPTFGYYFSKDKMFSFGNIADGIWYFHLKAQYLEGWGPTAHYQVKIDNTPPEFFKPSIEENGMKQSQIFFSALDNGSGVAYYEMRINEGTWQKVLSPYTITNQDKASKTMTLRAVDNVGNAVEAYIDLEKIVIIEKPAQAYNIIQPEITLASPAIDQVIMPTEIANIKIQNLLIVLGHSVPGSNIKLYLSSIPETILETQTDAFGYWKIIINKDLGIGKYEIYAIANMAGNFSDRSEKVYFTLVEPYKLEAKNTLPFIMALVAAIILSLFGVLFVINWIMKKKILEFIKKHGHRSKNKK
jgi:hypothetical protein